jgi:hypothetical protein
MRWIRIGWLGLNGFALGCAASGWAASPATAPGVAAVRASVTRAAVFPSSAPRESATPNSGPVLQELQSELDHLRDQRRQLEQSPFFKKSMTLAADPKAAAALHEIADSPKRMELVYLEIGWFLLIFMLRAWRNAKAPKWHQRLWTSLWTMALLWTGVLAFLPWLCFGEAYGNLIFALIGALQA